MGLQQLHHDVGNVPLTLGTFFCMALFVHFCSSDGKKCVVFPLFFILSLY
jgi:hypothetical protein